MSFSYGQFREFRRERNLWKNERVINRRVDWVYRTIYCHILEYPFLRLALALGLTPNQVTVIGILLGVAGAILFASGQYLTTALGAVLLQLALLTDWIDGDIARLRKLNSLKGAFLDKIMFDTVIPLLFFSIGVGAYSRDSDIIWLFLGFFAAFSYIANKHIYNLKILTLIVADRANLKEMLLKSAPSGQTNLKAKFTRRCKRRLRSVLLATDFIWTSPWIIIFSTLAALFNALYVIPLFYGVFHPILTIANYLRQLRGDFSWAYDWIKEANTFD
jgi:phosphatidylglycerophosphate synthase